MTYVIMNCWREWRESPFFSPSLPSKDGGTRHFLLSLKKDSFIAYTKVKNDTDNTFACKNKTI
jgi:hypothetical protein